MECVKTLDMLSANMGIGMPCFLHSLVSSEIWKILSLYSGVYSRINFTERVISRPLLKS